MVDNLIYTNQLAIEEVGWCLICEKRGTTSGSQVLCQPCSIHELFTINLLNYLFSHFHSDRKSSQFNIKTRFHQLVYQDKINKTYDTIKIKRSKEKRGGYLPSRNKTSRKEYRGRTQRLVSLRTLSDRNGESHTSPVLHSSLSNKLPTTESSVG